MSQPALTELRGKGAHADPIACVEDLPAEIAVKRVDRFPHSISQLVFHMNYWMEYERRRIRGEKPKYPEHNTESFPSTADSGEAMEWNRRWARFLELLSEYGDMAESSRAEQIESVHKGDQIVAGTLEAVLWQMAVHNRYHLGQIALMRRVLGEWPPRGG
jgi:uncharacterized damage-inducible protein DinB